DEFSTKCAAFCGKALEEATAAGGSVGFECHAGLDCRAIACHEPGREFVAIVGRTFLKADNYRKATERAISGDWSKFPPSKFFENILLTGSAAALDKAAEHVKRLIAESRAKIPAKVPLAEPSAKPKPKPETAPATKKEPVAEQPEK